MAENLQVRLTEEEFLKGKVSYPSNYIVVEMPPKQDIKTPSGIILSFNEDILYGEGESTHVADCAMIWGTLVKQVEKLYFSRKDVEHTMSWETEMVTQVGDTIWSHPLAMKNCQQLLVGDKVYSVIRYEDILVCKRGDEVICPNGNVIVELLPKEKTSEFDVLDKGLDKTRGRVIFTGLPNKRYQSKQKADISDLKVGDTIVIDSKTYTIPVERLIYNAHFEKGKYYFVVQQCDIEFVL